MIHCTNESHITKYFVTFGKPGLFRETPKIQQLTPKLKTVCKVKCLNSEILFIVFKLNRGERVWR